METRGLEMGCLNSSLCSYIVDFKMCLGKLKLLFLIMVADLFFLHELFRKSEAPWWRNFWNEYYHVSDKLMREIWHGIEMDAL